MANPVERLHVALGERSYDIVIGSGVMAQVGQEMAGLIKGRRCVIVSDDTVAPLYLSALEETLGAAGFKSDALIVPAGEATKSIGAFNQLCEDILALGIERSTVLIALGGGVIGDLTGFVASVLLRGVDFIQIPTTLLSQVDSSVGGKTGINAKAGKNLIGAFHQPLAVFIDTDSLNTLATRELLAGYAEVVKYGLINDPDFYQWLEANGAALIEGSQADRIQAILTSCRAKADVVAQDEKESGQRALLNLGHTFGHALEKECAYDGSLLHGEAVAIGMVMAFEFCASVGLCGADEAARLRDHLQSVGLPVDLRALPCEDWTAELLLSHMMKDKKVQDGKITFVLARGIGSAYLDRNVESAAILDYLTDLLTRSRALR